MRKLLLLMVVMTGFLMSAAAQDTARPHKIMDLVVTKVCNCIMKVKDSLSTMPAFNSRMTLCIEKEAIPRMKALAEEAGIDPADGVAMKEMGRNIGRRVAKECPGFMEMIMAIKAKEKEEKPNNRRR
jgi:hypothetical protein